MKTGLIIFHCDFVIDDNYSITTALKENDNVLFLLLINPEQIYQNKQNEKYFSKKASDFFCLASINLNEEIKKASKGKNELLMIIEDDKFYLPDFCKKNNIQNVYWNKLYSIYSINRDIKYTKELKKDAPEINVVENDEYYFLIPIDRSFKVFSAFEKYYSKKLVKRPIINDISHTRNLTKIKYNFDILKIKPDIEYEMFMPATTKYAQKLLNDFNKSDRDLGTYLSRYIALSLNGSLRSYYWNVNQKKDKFIRQLTWRSFYMSHTRNCPYFYSKEIYSIMEPRFLKIKWENDNKKASLFWEGRSGFPFLDSHVRMARETGYMYNRGRLEVASFCIKLLHCDPFTKERCGVQQQFSKVLIDQFGASQMLGNLLWVSSAALDNAGRRFSKPGTVSGRVFKGAISIKISDDETINFIRRWIPELKLATNREIAKWHMLDDNTRLNILKKTNGDLSYTYKLLINWEAALDKWYQISKVTK